MIFPKQKAYPKVLHVRGDTYKIRFVKGLKNLGETDAGTMIIRIRAGMSRAETFKTFLHEALHAIEFSTPIKIKHKMVYELEDAIFSLILDNFT